MRAPRLVIEGCAVAPVAGDEYDSGYVAIGGNRISAVGNGRAPEEYRGGDTRRIDADGCLATPGLVNCHHHLYQWTTRGLARQATLFEWLEKLYPIWALIDEEIEHCAARAGLASLALSGCTTTTDHHYVFPEGIGDLLGAEIEAAWRIGLRFHPCRGSMDLGESAGGLPPDRIVEDPDRALAQTEAAIERQIKMFKTIGSTVHNTPEYRVAEIASLRGDAAVAADNVRRARQTFTQLGEQMGLDHCDRLQATTPS
jgi:cytosine/adenosine deaminase-related metal-dependent hydrolase